MAGRVYHAVVAQSFHRDLLLHNRDEPELVRRTGLLLGRAARLLAHGLRVQAYNVDHSAGAAAYSFVTPVAPVPSYGFRDGQKVVREVYWPEGHPGVLVVENGTAVAIAASVTRVG